MLTESEKLEYICTYFDREIHKAYRQYDKKCSIYFTPAEMYFEKHDKTVEFKFGISGHICQFTDAQNVILDKIKSLLLNCFNTISLNKQSETYYIAEVNINQVDDAYTLVKLYKSKGGKYMLTKADTKRKELLNTIVRDITDLTSEVINVSYNSIMNRWVFVFTYAFPSQKTLLLAAVTKHLVDRGLTLHTLLLDRRAMYDDTVAFYLSESEIETYFVMNKLIKE